MLSYPNCAIYVGVVVGQSLGCLREIDYLVRTYLIEKRLRMFEVVCSRAFGREAIEMIVPHGRHLAVPILYSVLCPN